MRKSHWFGGPSNYELRGCGWIHCSLTLSCGDYPPFTIMFISDKSSYGTLSFYLKILSPLLLFLVIWIMMLGFCMNIIYRHCDQYRLLTLDILFFPTMVYIMPKVIYMDTFKYLKNSGIDFTCFPIVLRLPSTYISPKTLPRTVVPPSTHASCQWRKYPERWLIPPMYTTINHEEDIHSQQIFEPWTYYLYQLSVFSFYCVCHASHNIKGQLYGLLYFSF